MRKSSFSKLLIFGLVLSGLLGAVITPATADAAATRENLEMNSSIVAQSILRPITEDFDFPISPASNIGPAAGPAEAVIQTIPPVSGVAFQVAGRQFITGADGTVKIDLGKSGKYSLVVLTDTYENPYRRIEFARWLDGSFEPVLDIHVPATHTIEVGFNTYDAVGQKFVGPDGSAFDETRIQRFTIRSLQGDEFTLTDGQARWIPASRVTRRRVGGLEEVKLLYTVSEVMVDGSNVVNKSQQRFYASPNTTWTISLLLYSLRVTSTDALFGFPQGKTLALQFPDGHIQNYPLDRAGAAEIHSLARGNYSIEMLGANGWSGRVPLSLSRDQDVNAKVVTYLDMGVMGAAVLVVAIGLLLSGRPHLRHSLLGRKQPNGVHVYPR